MVKVGIEDIKLFGYHGFFEQESLIGGWFVYSVEISYDLAGNSINDELQKVIDYAQIYAIVQQVNAQRQQLIETLAFNIKNKLTEKFGSIQSKVRVTKLNPPLGGAVKATFFEC